MGDRDILALQREPGQSKWVMSLTRRLPRRRHGSRRDPQAELEFSRQGLIPLRGSGQTFERLLGDGPLNASPGRELVGSDADDRGDDKPRRSTQIVDDEKLNCERRDNRFWVSLIGDGAKPRYNDLR